MWATTIKAGRWRVFGYERWGKEWVKISSEFAQERLPHGGHTLDIECKGVLSIGE